MERKTVKLTLPSRLLRQLEQVSAGLDRIGLASQVSSALELVVPEGFTRTKEPTESVSPNLPIHLIEKLDVWCKAYTAKRSVVVANLLEIWLTMNVELVQTPRPHNPFKKGHVYGGRRKFRKYPGTCPGNRHYWFRNDLLKLIRVNLNHPEITHAQVEPHAKMLWGNVHQKASTNLAYECLRSIEFPGLPPAYVRWCIDNQQPITDSLLFEWRMSQQSNVVGM